MEVQPKYPYFINIHDELLVILFVIKLYPRPNIYKLTRVIE